MSWKRWKHAFCFENLAKKLQVQRKGNESCSPSSCYEDQYSKMKVLATRNPRYEESLEIILIHSLSSWILDFAWSAGSIPTLFVRDEQTLGVGLCWRSISMIFTANISPEFMIWGPTQSKSELLLTSSTSFGEHLNAGITCMKFGQNGRNPRPAGLYPMEFDAHLWSECSLFANASQSNAVSYKIHKPRPKGLSHDKMGPHAVLQLNPKPETVYEKNMQPLMNTSVDRRTEKWQA